MPGSIYYLYVLASSAREMEIGVTDNLPRVAARPGVGLVYVEAALSLEESTSRERQLRASPRSELVALVEAINPGWRDLRRTLGITGPG